MYIGRREDGTIYGSWSCKQPNDSDHPGIEEIDDDDAELAAFMHSLVPVSKEKPLDIETRLADLEQKFLLLTSK